MREFDFTETLLKKFEKLQKKDKTTYESVMRKIEEVASSPDIEHFKNLRYDFKDSKRVHVGHFVLVFSYDPSKDFVLFEDFDHHDEIYRR